MRDSGTAPHPGPDGNLRLERDHRGVVTVTLDRPAVRNAFGDALVDDLSSAVAALGADPGVRVVVLAGAGPAFCAGADLREMRTGVDRGYEEDLASARRMARMFREIWDLPQPVVARVQGPALGGGAGLVAVCDVAVADHSAVFAFPEVRLGIVPAVVSPYVVRKIGAAQARALFLTGERVDAVRAAALGLVHDVVEPADLDRRVAELVTAFLAGGPRALAVAKRLPEQVAQVLDGAEEAMPPMIARARRSPEGQEGLRAFLEGRAPRWAVEHS